MRFNLKWASEFGSRSKEGMIEAARSSGLPIAVQGSIEEVEYNTVLGVWKDERDTREVSVVIDTIEELKRLDDATGGNGLIIGWNEDGCDSGCDGDITVYDDYVE